MSRLEELTKGALVQGVLADRAVKVVDIAWHGSSAVTLTYTDELSGKAGQELLYRDDEARLAVDTAGRAWSMDADGNLFRLVSEAERISLAYLFDPFLAVQTSSLDPLPHQIDAVYDKMLPRQPLRFLLADDPGAGKTIMAGLFCKELIIRGDVERCLVIAPGSRAPAKSGVYEDGSFLDLMADRVRAGHAIFPWPGAAGCLAVGAAGAVVRSRRGFPSAPVA